MDLIHTAAFCLWGNTPFSSIDNGRARYKYSRPRQLPSLRYPNKYPIVDADCTGTWAWWPVFVPTTHEDTTSTNHFNTSLTRPHDTEEHLITNTAMLTTETITKPSPRFWTMTGNNSAEAALQSKSLVALLLKSGGLCWRFWLATARERPDVWRVWCERE